MSKPTPNFARIGMMFIDDNYCTKDDTKDQKYKNKTIITKNNKTFLKFWKCFNKN